MKKICPFFLENETNVPLFLLRHAALFCKLWTVHLFEKEMKSKLWTSCRKQKEMVFLFLKIVVNKLLIIY